MNLNEFLKRLGKANLASKAYKAKPSRKNLSRKRKAQIKLGEAAKQLGFKSLRKK